MPRAPRICATIDCPEQVTHDGRCEQHQRQAWAGSDRRAHLPRNWATIRRRILARDRHRCQIHDPGCLLIATEVDHLGGRDDHRPEMLRAACSPCHSHRTAMQGVDARATIAARSTRTPEPHPGLTE